MKRIWDKINDCWIYELAFEDIKNCGWKNPHNDDIIVWVTEYEFDPESVNTKMEE